MMVPSSLGKLYYALGKLIHEADIQVKREATSEWFVLTNAITYQLYESRRHEFYFRTVYTCTTY